MNDWKQRTLILLRALVHSLEQIRAEYESEVAVEKLSGNIVKQARAEGALYASACHIQAINDFIMAKTEEIKADEANKDPRCKEYLREMCDVLKSKLPDHYGFLLLAAPFGTDESGLVYASSMERKAAINVLKEWLIKCGAEEDWMKHID